MREIVEIPIEEIIIGDRAREDLGDLEHLQKSIKERGLIHSITVMKKTKELVDGYRRLMCHKNLGLPKIEARFYEDLSESEKKVVELEANLSKPLEWDEQSKLRAEIHALWQKERGKAIRGYKGRGQSLEESAEALGVSIGTLSQDIALTEAMKMVPKIAQFSSKKQALKSLGKIKEMAILTELARRDREDASLIGKNLPYSIAQGDALKLMPKMVGPETIDLVIFDPGWGIDSDIVATSRGPRGEKVFYDDSMETAFTFMLKILPMLYQVMKADSHMYFFIGIEYASYWKGYLTNTKVIIKPNEPPTFETLEKDRSWKFNVRAVPLIWVKEGGGFTDHDYKFMPRYETALFCTKGSKRLNYAISDVFEHNRPLSTMRIHPHQKPVELYKDFIKVSSLSDEVVLDPAFGSGVAIVSAILTGRRAIGFEKDKEAYIKAEDWIKGIKIEEGDEDESKT